MCAGLPTFKGSSVFVSFRFPSFSFVLHCVALLRFVSCRVVSFRFVSYGSASSRSISFVESIMSIGSFRLDLIKCYKVAKLSCAVHTHHHLEDGGFLNQSITWIGLGWVSQLPLHLELSDLFSSHTRGEESLPLTQTKENPKESVAVSNGTRGKRSSKLENIYILDGKIVDLQTR